MPGTRKLGKTTDQRMAMLRQQVTDFLDKGKMETTVTRAKEIKPMAEKMITLGKKGDLAAYRQAMSFITREDVCKKLFKEIAPGYAERNGGYTRIVRTGVRRGDAAETAMIELKEYEDSLKTYRNLKNSLDTAEEKGETKGEAKERVIGTGSEVNPQSWTQHLLFICEEEH